MPDPTPTPAPPACDVGMGSRRCFVAKTLVCCGGAAAAMAVPAATGLAAFLHPLKMSSQAGQFLRLATLDTLPADGTPQKVPVILDRTDAWNRFPNQPIGAVLLRRVEGDQVEALQVLCPHAGCHIEHDAKNDQYVCPCHKGHFDLAGKRLDESSPSPRDLDTLDVEIRPGGEVWVKYETFSAGTSKKVAEA